MDLMPVKPKRICLDQTVIEKLEEGVMSFLRQDELADAVGVHRATFYRWQKTGRDTLRAMERGAHGPFSEDELMCAEMVERLERAEPAGKLHALQSIGRSGTGEPVKITTTTVTEDAKGNVTTKTVVVEKVEKSWQANAWLLERRYPAEFALVNRMELSGPGGGPIRLSADVEELRARGLELVDELGHLRSKRAIEAGPSPNGREDEESG
jgi:hypothetical protein